MTKGEERRRYIRLSKPININFTHSGKDKVLHTVSKNVSAVGVGFETKEKLEPGSLLKLEIELPKAPNPVHVLGKVVWSKRVTLEDGSPHSAGIEFTKIEEDNKNTFLKYLCDITYTKGKNT